MRYLTLRETLALYHRIIDQSGGSRGIRDLGTIESSLAQPKMTFGSTDLYPTQAQIYQIKVTLQGSSPPIWRRIQVRGDTSLDNLHDIIQVVMGWTNSHLHQFIVGEAYFGPSDPEYEDLPMSDESQFTLSRITNREGSAFIYEYDFGDSWRHELLVEKIVPPEEAQYPICLAGERACPPEDVGGVWGYEEFLNALDDPGHPQHQDYIEWIGGEFGPETFDLKQVNAVLHLPRRRRYR